MAEFNVLVVQNNAILGNKQANFNNIEKIIEKYKNKKIDILVLPEVFAVGWKCSLFSQYSEKDEQGETSDFLKKLALNYKCFVFGGSYIRKANDGKLYNTCNIYSPDGTVIAQYDKMHIFQHFGEGEADYIAMGKKPVLVEIKGIRIGVSICYDIRFPELFRAYSQNNAKILINMAAWPKIRQKHWEILQKARAIENQAFVIAVSQCGRIDNEKFNAGHSMIISPFGEIKQNLLEEEGAFLHKINTNEVDEIRQNMPVLEDKNPYGYKL